MRPDPPRTPPNLLRPPPTGRRRRGAAIALMCAAVVLTVAGCGRSATRDAASRLSACQSLMVLLNPDGSTFDVSWTQPPADDGVVKILYTVSPPGNKPRRRILACTFERQTTEQPSAVLLQAVFSDGQPLGQARVALLNRFWMRSDQVTIPPPGGPPALPPPVKPSDTT